MAAGRSAPGTESFSIQQSPLASAGVVVSHRPPLQPRPAGAPAPATPRPPQRQRVLTTCNISQGRLAPNSTFIVVMVMMLVLSSKCVYRDHCTPPRRRAEDRVGRMRRQAGGGAMGNGGSRVGQRRRLARGGRVCAWGD